MPLVSAFSGQRSLIATEGVMSRFRAGHWYIILGLMLSATRVLAQDLSLEAELLNRLERQPEIEILEPAVSESRPYVDDGTAELIKSLQLRLELLEDAERTRQLNDQEQERDRVLQTVDLLELPPSPTDDITTLLSKRVAELEGRLKQRDSADAKAAAAAKKKFTTRPFGRIHIDSATFNQDAANKATVGNALNGTDIRRARLGAEGEGFGRYFYRFDVDFVTLDQNTAQRPVIVDAYLDMKEVSLFGNLRIGHFREPFGIERLNSTHDQPFLERSAPITAITPFRNIGVMAFDWNECETMTWNYGVFNENTNEFGEDYHDGTGVAGTGRVTWLPYYEEDGAELLHFGVSYSARHVGANGLRQFASTPEVILKQGPLPIQITPNFVNSGLLPIDNYQIAGVEFSTVLGPLSFDGEYVFTGGNLSTGPSFYFHGGYLETSFFWTGEHRNYVRQEGRYGAVTPKSGFFQTDGTDGCEWGIGAWESTARISYVDLNDKAIAGGQMTDYTVGLNWYYTVRSRVMFNYIRSDLDRGGVRSSADIAAVRFQYAF